MRRGYLRGLVIGGIVGLAVGKMLRYKESLDSDNNSDNNRDSNPRFHEDKEFPDSKDYDDHRHLDGGFDEKKYENHFSQYHDETSVEFGNEIADMEDVENHQMLDEEASASKVLQNYDGSEPARISRKKKTARAGFNRRKRMGSLDE